MDVHEKCYASQTQYVIGTWPGKERLHGMVAGFVFL